MALKRLWPLGVVLGLAGSAALGVFTADVEPLQATVEHPPKLDRLLDEIPQYPGSFFYPMGQQLRVDGKPREMAHALTPDPVHKVADRYEGIWNSRGYKTDRHVSDNEEWVVASDLRDPIVRTVVVTEAERGTVIIASVSEKFAHAESPIPKPASCHVVRSTGAQDGPVASDMLLLACQCTLAELTGFYDRALAGKKRAVHVMPTIDQKNTHISYAGAGLQISLVASQPSDDPPRTGATVTWQVKR